MPDTIEILEEVVSVVEIASESTTLLVVEEIAEVVEIATEGPQGPAGAPGGATTTKTAAVALSGHRAVTPRADGTVEYASNGDADHAGAALFLTTQAVAMGDAVTVQALGEITNGGWSWTPGPVWLGTNGQLTQTPPVYPAVFSRVVGAATSPTTVLWQPGATYLLTD